MTGSCEWTRGVTARLRTRRIGRPLHAYETVGSTNDVARALASAGAPEGASVLARAQERGRGRRGRSWSSPADQGVYLSVILRPRLSVADSGWLAVLGGVSAADALEEIGLRGLRLKWPNDVLVGGRKIAGVLVEPRAGAERIEFAILGIGVNVAQPEGAWTGALKGHATSCHMEGVDATCEEVALAVLRHLESWYDAFSEGRTDGLMRAWTARGGTRRVPVVEESV